MRSKNTTHGQLVIISHIPSGSADELATVCLIEICDTTARYIQAIINIELTMDPHAFPTIFHHIVVNGN